MLPTGTALGGRRVFRDCISNHAVHSLMKQEDWVGIASRPVGRPVEFQDDVGKNYGQGTRGTGGEKGT